MKNRRLLLCMPHMSGNEMKYIEDAMAGNWAVPMGPHVDAFERELEKYLGLEGTGKRVVALCSGTAAIHLALVACGVGAGDEVICQSMTFAASANPVTYVGATPVFVDSESQTWNIDPELLDKSIADRIALTSRKPKAIIIVHLYGMPGQVDEIRAVANKYAIPVIEDAAEAFGSRYNGQAAGTFGDFGILSFNGNKMITTSGGGALIVPNDEVRQRVLYFSTQARESYPYYHHSEVGFNYRLSNISACIGLGQMTVLDQHLAHHRRVHEIYAELFAGDPRIILSGNPSDKFDANFWLSTILLSPDVKVKGRENAYSQPVGGAIGGAASVTRQAAEAYTDCQPSIDVEAMRLRLGKLNIESRPLWKPMHCQPVFAKSPAYVAGTSEALFNRGLCLPSGPDITLDDQKFIVNAIFDSIR